MADVRMMSESYDLSHTISTSYRSTSFIPSKIITIIRVKYMFKHVNNMSNAKGMWIVVLVVVAAVCCDCGGLLWLWLLVVFAVVGCGRGGLLLLL